MSDVYITDCDCITALGADSKELYHNLAKGQCGFKPITRFPTDNYVNNIGGAIKALDDISHGRRFDFLLDMLLDGAVDIPNDCVLLSATTKGNIESLEAEVRNCPADAPAVEPVGRAAEAIAKKVNLAHGGYNISTACASSSMAVLIGAEMISNGRTDAVLVCGADILSEFVFSGFSALKAMSTTTARPFDVNRDGLILGEAAAYMLLMSASRARKEGRKTLGIITGWGAACDATHITAPARDACGLKEAVVRASAVANVRCEDIAAINTHGTGTAYNDAMEMTAFAHIFGNSVPPMFSIKGAIGHCLGPGGLVEIIVGLRSLDEQRVPGTVGLVTPEKQLGDCLCGASREIRGDSMLKTNSGFGGINVALVLQKGDAA